MKKFSVVVRVEYIIELEAEDSDAAEARAEELFKRGSTRLFQSADVESVQADEMGT